MFGCSVEKATTTRPAPLPDISTTYGLTCRFHDASGIFCDTRLSKENAPPFNKAGFFLPSRQRRNPADVGPRCTYARLWAKQIRAGCPRLGAAQIVLASHRARFIREPLAL